MHEKYNIVMTIINLQHSALKKGVVAKQWVKAL